MRSVVLPESEIWVLLNNLYSNPLLIAVVVVILAIWTYFNGRPVATTGRRIRRALDSMRDTMVRTGDAPEVARSYPTLFTEFRSEPTVGDSWVAMDRTLLRPTQPDGVYRQMVPASEFFGIQLLAHSGADLRAARAHANALVGVGLVLTFLGLVLALKAAGSSLGTGTPTQVQEGLGRLLGTAASKFAFSVAALLLSLLSAAWVRWETGRLERSLSSFIAAIDRRLPPITAQEVASETQVLLRADSATRRKETDQLAEAIGARFDQSLSTRLGEAIQPLATAISQMTRLHSEITRKAIQDMADQFLERLEGSSGRTIREATVGMERVGGHVSGLATTLAEVRDGLAGAGTAAALEIAQAASDAARSIADAAGAASASLKAAGPDWERSSANAAQLLREGVDEATDTLKVTMRSTDDALSEKIFEATIGMERVGGRVAALATTLAEVRDGLAGAGVAAAREISQATADAARRVADAAETAYGSLSAAGPEWERSSATAAALLREGILGTIDALRLTVGVAGGALSESIDNAAARASSRLEDGARKVEERLSRAASDAGREIRGAGGAVAAAGKEAGAALSAAGGDAYGQLSSAAALVRETTTEVGVQSEALSGSLRDWERASGEATALVARAASVLDAAAARIADGPASLDVLHELRSIALLLTRITEEPESGRTRVVPAEPPGIRVGEV